MKKYLPLLLVVFLLATTVVQAKQAPHKSTSGVEQSVSGDMDRKIATLLENQQQIIGMLTEMKEELHIIKIRASH